MNVIENATWSEKATLAAGEGLGWLTQLSSTASCRGSNDGGGFAASHFRWISGVHHRLPLSQTRWLKIPGSLLADAIMRPPCLYRYLGANSALALAHGCRRGLSIAAEWGGCQC